MVETFDSPWAYQDRWVPVGARRLTLWAFVCAALGVVVLPIVLGPLGVGLGVAGGRRGDRLGRWAAVASAAALCLGTLVGTFYVAALQR